MFPGFPLPVKDQHLVTDIFKIAGTYYWVCPPGVYIVWLTGVASGGSSTAHASYTCSGGGGGEGVYMYPVIVIPGTVYTIVVGASVASGAGQNTSFGSLLTLLGGGAGQTQPYTYMPGSGGGMFGGVGVTTQVKGSSARNITSIHECGAAGGVSNGTGTMAGEIVRGILEGHQGQAQIWVVVVAHHFSAQEVTVLREQGQMAVLLYQDMVVQALVVLLLKPQGRLLQVF